MKILNREELNDSIAVVNMPAVKKLELYSEYDVPTSELSEAEIYIARAHDVLRVEPDGCGFVPRVWLEQIRTFREALNQPSLLRRIMPPVPVVGVPPYPEVNPDLRTCQVPDPDCPPPEDWKKDD